MPQLTATDIMAIQLEVCRDGAIEMFERALSKLFGPPKPYVPPTPRPEVAELAKILGEEASLLYISEQEAIERFLIWCANNLQDWRTNPQTTLFWDCFEEGQAIHSSYEDEDY